MEYRAKKMDPTIRGGGVEEGREKSKACVCLWVCMHLTWFSVQDEEEVTTTKEMAGSVGSSVRHLQNSSLLLGSTNLRARSRSSLATSSRAVSACVSKKKNDEKTTARHVSDCNIWRTQPRGRNSHIYFNNLEPHERRY